MSAVWSATIVTVAGDQCAGPLEALGRVAPTGLDHDAHGTGRDVVDGDEARVRVEMVLVTVIEVRARDSDVEAAREAFRHTRDLLVTLRLPVPAGAG